MWAATGRDRPRGRARLTGGFTSGLIVAALLLTGCASESVAGWDPPLWNETPGVRLVDGVGGTGVLGDADDDVTADDADVADDAAPEGDAATADESGDTEKTEDAGSPEDLATTKDPDDESAAKPESDVDADADADADAGATTQASAAKQEVAKEVLPQRIRNDAVGIAARWVYLPGEQPFNARIDELIWGAVNDAGEKYQPEVFDAKDQLDERGCVPGSLAWPAARVLSDAATGPTGGTGTAVTCEIADAFGNYVGVSLRVVSGDDSQFASDTRTTIYANLTTGELIESDEIWNKDAAPDLWLRTVEQLRRQAGALSTAPLRPPSEEQVALASEALDAAQIMDGGGLTVTIAAGIAAPELEGLGVRTTTRPVQVTVDADTAAEWGSLSEEILASAVNDPFVGLPVWTANTHVDCALVPCVALTYDDGPSVFTPELLETLRETHTPATFFMVGRAIEQYPETVVDVSSAGHEVASHTMTHGDLTKLKKKKEMKAEVLDAADLITAQTGLGVTSYRPPYGALNDKVMREVKLPAVLWTVDTLDWEKPSKKELVSRATKSTVPGDIVLFHDIHEESVEAQGQVISVLRERGFVPVTVTQLFDGEIPSGRVTNR